MSARPRMVYVMGSMGSGKSTFTAELLRRLGAELGPLAELEEGTNARGSRIRLRGHHADGLVYLGKMRETHPGQDGLDRATTILVEPWLRSERAPEAILTEGRLFLNERCMNAFAEHTEMLVVHLHAEEWVLDLRFAERGTNQTWPAVKTTITLAERWSTWAEYRGLPVVSTDTAEPYEWETAQQRALDHLLG